MAEDKKPSRSSKMYGKGPKIEPEGKGDIVKSEGGAPKEAASEAKDTAGDPPSHTTKDDAGKSGTEAKGDVMAGTDGIPTHHVQSGERTEAANRHMMEAKDMLGRHERDHLARSLGHGEMTHEDMNKAHEAERRVMNTRHEGDWRAMGKRHADVSMPTKDEGKSGTNPE